MPKIKNFNLSISPNIMLNIIFNLILLFLLTTARAAYCTEIKDSTNNLSILADASMSKALTEIIREYSRKNNVSITSSYDDSATLADKITAGENADIFISSHKQFITNLQQEGLIDISSISNLFKNKLALVSPKDLPLNKKLNKKANSFIQLQNVSRRSLIVMSDPDTTSLGLYSKNSINNLGQKNNFPLWQNIENKIIRANGATDTIYLLTYGKNPGIVFYSDAYNNKDVDIISIFPENNKDPIIYQAAVVVGEHTKLAKNFLEFLKSETAKQTFKRYGFTPI